MSVEFESPIDLNQLEIQNVQLQQLGSDPLIPVEGQIYWRSDAHRPRVAVSPTDKQYLVKNNDDKISMNVTPSATVLEGEIGWNSTDHTLNIGMEGGVVQQVGQEFFIRAHNESGVTILNGKAVKVTTSGTPDGHLHIALADKTTVGGDAVIAVATMDIPHNSMGLCTKYGMVRGINTSTLVEGAKVYLSTAGGLSATPGVWPDYKTKVGYCSSVSATTGEIYVSVDNSGDLEMLHDVDVQAVPTAGSSLVYENGRWTGKNFAEISKEVTGFTNPSLVVVTYNSASRTVTLTGTVQAFWRNLTITALVSGWTSPAHLTGRTATQYLYYDGTNFVWGDGAPWTFDQLQICAVVINPAGTVITGIRECHSTMQWQSHLEFHSTIGCYLSAGGDVPPASWTANSYVTTNRRPDIDTTYLSDEDLPSTLAGLTSKSYTRFNLTGASTMVFTPAQTEIVSVTGAIPNWNQWNGSTWVQTPMIKDQYACVFVLAMPVTADASSQANRYVFIQPQTVTTSLATIQGLTPNSVNLNGLAGLNPELCFINKIIIRYDGPSNNNWLIYSIEKLLGTKISQSAVVGNFLSAVTVDGTTILGNGTTVSPLSVGAIAESQVTNLVTDLASKVVANTAIVGATKTKITYDTKGLVTVGADAGIADITGLQGALDLKAPLASPVFTGTVQTPKMVSVGTARVDDAYTGFNAVIELGTRNAITCATNDLQLKSNSYAVLAGPDTAIALGKASLLDLNGVGGSLAFYVAPSVAAGATQTFAKTFEVTDAAVSSTVDLLPNANNTRAIGSNTLRWANVQATEFYEAGTLLSAKYAPFAHVGAGGTGVHALVVAGGANGFISGTDKTKLDGLANATGGTPALTLGTANTAGNAATFLRTNDTILAFDTTVPANPGTAAVGTATVAARRDHVHNLQTSVTGNAGTVTTNANLTGPVTSVGNATAVANGALLITMVNGLDTTLAQKLDKNVAIVGAQNTKITYDSKGLVTSGTTLIASDIPAHTNATGATIGQASPTVFGHSKASSAIPLVASGTGAVGTDNGLFAREAHVHPVQASVTGNAGTATALATPRAINGVNFDGTAAITVADSTKVPRTGDSNLTGSFATAIPLPGVGVSQFGWYSDTNTANTYVGMGVKCTVASQYLGFLAFRAGTYSLSLFQQWGGSTLECTGSLQVNGAIDGHSSITATSAIISSGANTSTLTPSAFGLDVDTSIAATGSITATANITATGNVNGAVVTASGVVFQAYTTAGYWAAYGNGVTPSATNHHLGGKSDGTSMSVNATTQSNLAVSGTPKVMVTATGVGFLAKATTGAPAAPTVVGLTNSTTGVVSNTVSAISTWSSTAHNNANASMVAKINEIRLCLINNGLMV